MRSMKISHVCGVIHHVMHQLRDGHSHEVRTMTEELWAVDLERQASLMRPDTVRELLLS